MKMVQLMFSCLLPSYVIYSRKTLWNMCWLWFVKCSQTLPHRIPLGEGVMLASFKVFYDPVRNYEMLIADLEGAQLEEWRRLILGGLFFSELTPYPWESLLLLTCLNPRRVYG